MYSLCSISLSRRICFRIAGHALQARHAIDHVARQVEAVQVVQHGHVERRGGGAFFFVSAHVQIVVIGAPIGQAMNQPGIAVKGEDDGLVGR